MKTLLFSIPGLHCTSCARALQNTLSRQPGVEEAQVNFIGHTARVVYNEALVSPQALRQTADRMGFNLILQQD